MGRLISNQLIKFFSSSERLRSGGGGGVKHSMAYTVSMTTLSLAHHKQIFNPGKKEIYINIWDLVPYFWLYLRQFPGKKNLFHQHIAFLLEERITNDLKWLIFLNNREIRYNINRTNIPKIIYGGSHHKFINGTFHCQLCFWHLCCDISQVFVFPFFYREMFQWK